MMLRQETGMPADNNTDVQYTQDTQEAQSTASASVTKNSNDDIRELVRIYQAGGPDAETALVKVFQANEPLIGHIIRKRFPSYIQKYYQDLFSCGKVGLLNAIKKYDPDKSKPSTYFTFYIHHEIYEYVTRYLGGSTSFKASRVTEVSYAMQRLEDCGIVDPDPEQVAWEMTREAGEKVDARAVADAMGIRAAAQTKDYISDDYLDGLMTEFGESPENIYLEKEKEQALAKEFQNALTPQEKVVVMRMHNLDRSGKPSTHEAIAVEAGCMPDQVRGIYQKAIRKLRNSSLADFYPDRLKSTRKQAQEVLVQWKPSKQSLVMDAQGRTETKALSWGAPQAANA